MRWISKKEAKLNFNSKKILIIDDDKTLLDILSQLFDRLGCEPICAGSGDDGLHLFMKKRPEVVLTDFDMPGMDGITLAYHIKAIYPDTLVILMTGHDRTSILKQTENSKIDAIMFKPFELLEIIQVLQEKETGPMEKAAYAL